MIRFFKRLFGKKEEPVVEVENVDNELKMVRYARQHNVAIVVGSQDVYEYMRSFDKGISILRVGNGYTFEVRDTSADKMVLHESVNPEIRQWMMSDPQFTIVEMEK